ncbi:MAG: glycosyltransferase family 2 protein [Planctomycetota bacterium]
MVLTLAIIALLLSVFPAVMFLVNLPLFCADLSTPFRSEEMPAPKVSVLIPARDEEKSIGHCIRSALGCEHIDAEVVVMDDASEDRTAEIVAEIAETDKRVRLISGKPLPEGWNGKQHACKQLADAAAHEWLVFIDADVRLRPTSLASLIRYQNDHQVGLLSAFPNQITGTWFETWLIPMMHFILLCYLPFSRMRSDGSPSLAAGCGQLFLSRREDYIKAGTHEAIRQSRHDGVKLPRAYRENGLTTDVVDGTRLASCRMYTNTAEVVRGALKNAIEGIANPRVIVIFTVLLFGCSVLPLLATAWAIEQQQILATVLSLGALVVAHVPRFVAAARLKQSWLGACCHIPATLAFLVLQWLALFNHLTGRQIAWRGRTQT